MRKIAHLLFILTWCALPTCAQSGAWKPLFNGKVTNGWEHVGPGRFVLDHGLLKSEGGMGLLWYTKEKIGNAKIRVVYKLTGKDTNSGVYIRIPEKPTEPWMPVNKGNEIQILNSGDDAHCTGVVYSFSRVLARPDKPVGEWNTLEITIQGPHTVVYLNGVKTTDHTQGSPNPPEMHEGDPDRGVRPDAGYIGLQNHDDGSVIYFREVAVQPLS